MSLYKNILVPIDGSTQSRTAFQKALALATEIKATLTIAHVVDTRAFQSIISYDPIMAQKAKEEAERALQEFVKQGEEIGIHIQTVVVFGSPREAISFDLPQDYNIDLIIMSATGMSALERMVIGSVSDYVTRHALCDVSIIRTNQEMKSF